MFSGALQPNGESDMTTGWTYDETKHCGVDYHDAEQVRRYDENHLRFRNYDREVQALLTELNLPDPKQCSLADMGCGTGALAVTAAKHFRKIYAVDVSPMMLEVARQKAEAASLSNIEFITAGFLSYRHRDDPVDIVTSKAALHHLPDFWKQTALLTVNRMLKCGGVFYLFDVVFHFSPQKFEQKINGWIDEFEKKAGSDFRQEVEVHIREEYSTFGWILEGMLQRAGFSIETKRTADGFSTEYFCRKLIDC